MNRQNSQFKDLFLSELQTWLRQVFVDPCGSDRALSQSIIKADTVIESTSDLSASQRLKIYAEAYFSRILESLSDDFSKIKFELGEVAFQQLVADYLIAHPSTSQNITDIGAQLPKFIFSHVYGVKVDYLADLAKLEWVTLESFYSPVTAHFDFSKLAELTEEQWLNAVPIIDPSLIIAAFDYDVVSLWHDADFEIGGRELTHAAVLTINGQAIVEKLSAAQLAVIELIHKGSTLSDLNTQLADNSEVQENLMTWFSNWTSQRLICGVNFGVRLQQKD